jgi:hypothetical protein
MDSLSSLSALLPIPVAGGAQTDSQSSGGERADRSDQLSSRRDQRGSNGGEPTLSRWFAMTC